MTPFNCRIAVLAFPLILLTLALQATETPPIVCFPVAREDQKSDTKKGTTERNAWRGLVPLRSTRKDVEVLLGPAQTVVASIHIYKANTETVEIRYATQKCSSGRGDWDVPIDTVEEISVSPMSTVLLRDLDLDLSKYKRVESTHPENVFYYSNSDDGIVIRTRSRGGCEEVTSITYGPSANDKKLHCSNAPSNLL